MISSDYVVNKISYYKKLSGLYRKDVIEYHPYNCFKWSIQKLNYQTDCSFNQYSCINYLQANLFAYESRLLREIGAMIV